MGDLSELGWAAVLWVGLGWAWLSCASPDWSSSVQTRPLGCGRDSAREPVSAPCLYHSI